MIALRHCARFVRDLVMYAIRSGRWWVAFLIPTLAIAAIVILTAKTVVPTAVYVFF